VAEKVPPIKGACWCCWGSEGELIWINELQGDVHVACLREDAAWDPDAREILQRLKDKRS
jgi:hypothetical protein